MDIKGFISDFVCDVDNSIDITDMQETIRYYKQWEQELEMVKKRLAVLGEVEKSTIVTRKKNNAMRCRAI